ncbi:MAG: CHASE2 domain-containing protein [Cyanobacteria bacterium P01_E01_bin.6]
MEALVVFNLGQGNCQTGLPNVTVRLQRADESYPSLQWTGQLPPVPELEETYRRWRSLYKALHARLGQRFREQRNPSSQNSPYWHRSTLDIDSSDPVHESAQFSASMRSFEFDADVVTNVSDAEFQSLCEQIRSALNRWLGSKEFVGIEQQLRTHSAPDASIRVIVETDDPCLQVLPWHLWAFFDDYPKAEIALSKKQYRQVSLSGIPAQEARAQIVRILAVLGHSEGIDVQQDQELLKQIPRAEVVVLEEPSRADLNDSLWNEQGWDVLFFAGHSTSQSEDLSGYLAINSSERIAISDLKHALKGAIAKGLKLAIFNSCDGLGLGRALADLNIPQMIVMREPIADRVAQEFLKYFLQAFSTGATFYQSVRQAREQLQGLEGEFPGASWLPVIYQNPAEKTMMWPNALSFEADVSDSAQPSGVEPDEEVDKNDGGQTNRRTGSRLTLRHCLLASFSATVLVMGFRFLGVLQPVELAAYDHLMRSRPSRLEASVDSNLLVVEITDEDTETYRYPIEDGILAEAIEQLHRHQPRAIGIDLHRHQPNGSGRNDLIRQFQEHPNVFTVCSFEHGDRTIYSHPAEFSPDQIRNQVGFSDIQTDAVEGNRYPPVRRHLLSYDPTLLTNKSTCATPFSLSLQLSHAFLAVEGAEVIVTPDGDWQLGSVILKRLAARTGGYQDQDGHSNQILLNYWFNAKPAQRITLTQLLTDSINENLIRDRVILIGTTDRVGRDYFETPYGTMPGVWVHAHMVSQVVHAVLHGRSLMWVLPQQGWLQWGDFLFVWVWAMLGAMLVLRIRPPWILILSGGMIILVLYGTCWLFILQSGWMPLIPSLLSFVLAAGAFGIYGRSKTQQQIFSGLKRKKPVFEATRQ